MELNGFEQTNFFKYMLILTRHEAEFQKNCAGAKNHVASAQPATQRFVSGINGFPTPFPIPFSTHLGYTKKGKQSGPTRSFHRCEIRMTEERRRRP